MTDHADPGSLYLFPSDLLDEGPAHVASVARDLGFSSLSVAVAYHQARDVVPHRSGGRLRYRRDGVFFAPAPELWQRSALRPSRQSAEECAALDALLALDDRPAVEAWVVFLHNTGLGMRHPSAASVSCFGDRVYSNLCPSVPEVQEYALALAGDVASRGLDVVAEALSAQTFAHGHHHERSFAPIGGGDEALLGLCFCAHCSASAEAAGADVERLAAGCRDRVDAAFDGAAGFPAEPGALAEAVGDDVLTLIAARTDAVTRLTRRTAAAVHARGRRLAFMDLTGAVLGYADGRAEGAPAAEQAWRLAIDPGAVAEHVDAYTVLGYVRDPARLAADVSSIRSAVGDVELRVILRPGHPDTDSAEHYRAKAAAAVDGGADRVDVYNYGMAPLSVLGRVRARDGG